MSKHPNEPCRCDLGAGHLCDRCSRERDAHKAGLSACPFCGSMDLTLDNLVDLDDFGVNCNCCEVQQISAYTREDAIRRWNIRP